MKKNDFADLKNKTVDQIKKFIDQQESGKLDMIIQSKTTKIKNVHAIRAQKKDIARAKTLLAQKIFVQEKGV